MKHRLNFHLVICVFISLLCLNGQSVFSQEDRTRFLDKEVDAGPGINGEFLKNWVSQMTIANRIERDSAIRVAQRYGYPTEGVSNGRAFILQGFDDSGQLRYSVDDNAISASVINTDDVHPNGGAGLSLTGAGRTFAVWENSRPLFNHVELAGRLSQPDNSNRPFGDHATHVAGTMIAAGANPAARGMAYQANLRSFDTANDLVEMATEADLGLRVSNHSYGSWAGWHLADHANGQLSWHWFGNTSISQSEDYKFGQYDTEARNWDNVVFNFPLYLPVKSAGNSLDQGPPSGSQHWVRNTANQWVVSTTPRPVNGADGYDCIPTIGNAKNILTVGSLTREQSGGFVITGMSDFSSTGPTDDGRIKPDIVAMGEPVFSSISTSPTAYGILGGTSMAAPAVAGSLHLLLEHFSNLSGGFTLRASALKALVIHTADQFGSGSAPNYTSGWGVMDTRAAADLITDSYDPDSKSFLRSRDSLFEDETRQYAFYHDGIGPFKATIAWTDVPGPVQGTVLNSTTSRLVNDLDVRLISLDDYTTYHPWRLNPSSPGSAATKGDNFRDNVEQVFEANPPEGEYVVQISHKGTLTGGFQIFSTVVTGGEYLGIFRDELEMATAIDLQPNPVIQAEAATVSFNITNRGLSTFNGEISLDLYDASWEYLGEIESKSGLSLCPGCSFQNDLEYNFTLNEPLGDYHFVVWYKPNNGGWQEVADGNFDNVLDFSIDDPPAVLLAAPSSFNLGASAGQRTVNLVTNCNSWSVTGLPNWIMANPSSGNGDATINLTFLENTSIQSRSATITIGGCGLTQDIPVTQAGASAVLTASPTTVNLNAQSGNSSFNITSNCSWSIANIPGWLMINQTSGTGNATINFSYLENTSTQSRSVILTVNGCNLSEDIMVTQAGTSAVLMASPTTINLNAQSGNSSFNITSNCSWSIANIPGWLMINQTSGTGNATINFSYLENTSTQPRSVILTVNGCNLSEDIMVTQAGTSAVLTASPTTVNLNAQSGNSSFNITSNCSWSIANIPGWLMINQTSGTGNATINFSYLENTSTQPRSATLTISGCGLEQQLAVTQVGCNLPAPPNLNQAGILMSCPNEPVPLTASACMGCSVVWSNNQSGNTISVSDEGVYFAIATNGCGESQPSLAVTIEHYTSPSSPIVSANGPTVNLCPDATVLLTAANVCNGCTVVWSDGQTGNPIIGTPPNTYAAYVLENQCQLQSGDSDEITLFLADTPPVAILSLVGTQTICTGTSLNVEVQNVCAGCSVIWSNGMTGTNVNLSSAGSYTATMIDGCDVQGGASQAVVVAINDSAPTAQVTPAGPIAGCTGETITLTSTGCPTCDVVWSNGWTGPILNVTTSGIYTATYSNECGDGMTSQAVEVNLIDYVPEITVNNDCYLAAPNGTDYQWFFQGMPIATGQFFTAEETGYYSLFMTNNDGCSGTSDPLFINDCFTPVQNITALSELSVYPNPVQSTAYFSLSLNQPVHLQIDLLTLDGRLVQSVFNGDLPMGPSVLSTDVSALVTGVYLYRLISEEGVQLGKLVVQ